MSFCTSPAPLLSRSKRKMGMPSLDTYTPLNINGVTSMSADLHKYGYAAKGASVVLYRSGALRKHQFFTYGGWNGGLYASPSFCGTRPGGAIAAAWAVMHQLGEAGYLTRAQSILDSTATMQTAMRRMGLTVLGEPVAGVFAFNSDKVNVYELAAAVARFNSRVSVTERVRRHVLAPPFTIENGLLTPSHKVRRAAVLRLHRRAG